MIETRITLATLVLTAAFVGIPSIVIAQDSSARNVDQYTCKDIMRGSDDSRTTAIAFLHGYLLGKSGSSAFDLDTMAKQTDAFIDACLDNPNDKAANVMMKIKSAK